MSSPSPVNSPSKSAMKSAKSMSHSPINKKPSLVGTHIQNNLTKLFGKTIID
jgi:hypothetical protein